MSEDVLRRKLHETLDDYIDAWEMLEQTQQKISDLKYKLAALDGTKEHIERLERIALAVQKVRVAKTESEWGQANYELDNALVDAGYYYAGYYYTTTSQDNEIKKWRNTLDQQRNIIASLHQQITHWTEHTRRLGETLSKIARDHNDGRALTGENAAEYQRWAKDALEKHLDGLLYG